jgi:hypothetical protein
LESSDDLPDFSLGGATQMDSRVISLRLPKALYADLERSAAKANLSRPGGLDLLLRCSIANCELLAKVNDCPGLWDAKLDARIPISTFLQLRSACERLGIPVSVYIRKLLYHFYVTKHLGIVESNGHYTLAYRHD